MYTITLEVNQICNLRCTYCYLGRKTNQKPGSGSPRQARGGHRRSSRS